MKARPLQPRPSSHRFPRSPVSLCSSPSAMQSLWLLDAAFSGRLLRRRLRSSGAPMPHNVGLRHRVAADPHGCSPPPPWSSGIWQRLRRSSVRRLLAYSAIAHAGYILLGLAFFGVDSNRLSAECDSLLHPHLRPHHHRRLWRGRRRRARHRLRQARLLPRPAQAQPAARRRSARPLPLARRNSAAGRLLGQVQSLCRGPRRLRPGRFPLPSSLWPSP